MNNFMNRLSNVFAQKDLSDYPGLCNRKSNSLSYTILVASSAVMYDAPHPVDTINWKSI